jgi:hypothetical protein
MTPHLLLKCPERQRWREDLLDNKWPYIKEEIALRELLIVSKINEQRNWDTFAYKMKCK